MFHDLRFALRALLKSPGFALVAIVSLALGIGANTTIFSLVNEVLLKSLPVREPERLVLFSWSSKDVFPRAISGWSQRDPITKEDTSTSFSLRTFEAFRAANAPLADVFAFAPITQLNVILDGQAEVVANSVLVSGNYHGALGVPMAAGRTLLPTDDDASSPPVVVISHAYWQRRFGGDPAAIGRTLLVNNVPCTVVGVTAPQFVGTLQVGELQDLTLPFSLQLQLQPDNAEASEPWFWWVRIMARLQPSATHAQVVAALVGAHHESIKGSFNEASAKPAAATNEDAAAQPSTPPEEKVRLRVESGAQGLAEARRTYAKSLWVLTSLVGLVLLVACANVANLLLARGAAREREISVRLALGASRARLLRQLLTESLLLALLGAATGLVLAHWGKAALVALQPLGRGGLTLELALDWRVLGFTTAVAVATGVLFGLAPAWRATRTDLSAGASANARALGSGSRSWLARGLMVAQVGLSLVLLIGAGLFTRTLVNLQQVDAGFDRSQLLLFRLDAMAAGKKREDVAPLYARVAERLAALPGVESATYSQMPVLSNSRWTTSITVPGYTPAPGTNQSVIMNGVSPDFFATYQIPVLLGRAFTARDDASAPKVAIVNQAFAQKYFGEESPVGKRVSFGGRGGNAGTEIEIIGLTRDARLADLKEKPAPALYAPFTQLTNARWGNFALRVRGDAAAFGASVQALARDIDSTVPVAALRTQDEQVARSLASERLFARLSGFFGGLALLLAAIGLYGLLSYSVLRRTGEIGLRMALGALPVRVLWMVVRESLLLVLAGIAVGLAGAFAAARLIESQLFGLSPTDPATYLVVSAVLLGVALLAAFVPARRAAKVDPMVALRTE